MQHFIAQTRSASSLFCRSLSLGHRFAKFVQKFVRFSFSTQRRFTQFPGVAWRNAMCSWLLRLVSQIGRTIPSLHRRTRFHPDKTVLSRIRDIETKITQQQQKLDIVHEDLQQLISKLSLITTRDPMTGLENYSCFQSRLAELLRGKEPFALVFLDLDNLKTINTNRGHLAGDEFIIRASHVLYDSIRRKSDRNWLFRRNQAADEFLLILRGADL